MKRNEFCVLAVARSGTNFFVSNLEKHRQILCHYEPFNKNRILLSGKEARLPRETVTKLSDKAKRDSNLEGYLEDLVGNTSVYWGTQYMSIGFKYLYGHIDIMEYLFKRKQMKAFVIERKNRLQSFSSLMIAIKSKKWWSNEKPNKQVKVTFDQEQFQHYCDYVDKFYADVFVKLQENNMPYKHLFYKEITKPGFDFDDMYTFLERDSNEKLPIKKTKTIKQNSNNVLDRFENPDAVVKFLNEKEKELYLS